MPKDKRRSLVTSSSAQDMTLGALKLVDRSSHSIPTSPQPSHVDSLPNELLAEIFKLGRSTDYQFGLDIRPPNEVFYSHVSRRWRDVATNLPTLWTRIHVIVRVHPSLLWLPDYLSRSQRCHLDIWIDHWRLRDCDPEDRRNKITDIMNLLIPHADRWSTFSVDGLYERLTYLALSHLENLSAPVLRELTACFQSQMEAEWVEENSLPFDILQGGAPLLTSIYMDTLLYCRPPLSALTTCTIYQFDRSVAFMQLIRGLAASHALTKLCVYGHTESQPFEGSAGPSLTRLETLKSLRLDMTLSFTSHLLLAISAPRLETLQLKGVIDDNLRLLFDSSHRSRFEFPTLHTLSLDIVKLDGDSYIKLSRMLPSISHLKIKGAHTSDIRILARSISAPRHAYDTDARDTSDGGRVTADIIWPKLHTIMVGNPLDWHESDLSDPIGNVLCDMLAARRALGRPMRLVLGDKALKMVEGTDGLRGYLELWEHPCCDES